MAETRTQAELESPNYNYFIALKLGAKETNQKVIEKAIADIRGSADDDAYRERLKKLVNDMTDVMVTNTEARKQEAARAIEFKLGEMMELVKNICINNGRIFKSELQALALNANKGAQYYTFPDLEKRFLTFINGSNIKYIDDVTGVRIPFNDFDRISDSLQSSLRMTSLYEFLGLPMNASTPDIEKAKSAKYNEYMSLGDRAKKGLGKTLCGDVETILLSAEPRKQYDYYVKIKDSVWKQFALRKQYGAKSISLKEYYGFAQVMKDTLKLDIDAVEVMLGAGLKAYGLTVAGGEKDGTGVKDLEICPYPDCGKIYESGAKVCPHCGKPLEILCWNCGGKMAFTMKSKTCGNCRATYQSKDRYQKGVAKVDSLLRAAEVDIPTVEMEVGSLKNIVPDYSKFPTSTIFKKVEEYNAEIKKFKDIEENTGKKYRAAVEQAKKFMAAKNYLQAKNAAENVRRSFPQYKPQDTAKLIADIDAVVRRAQAELQSARNFIASGNEDGGVAAVLRALDICADFNEAKQFISKYPPRPPMGVRCELGKDSVKIVWQLSPSRTNTTYSVIRKVGTMPANPEDGAVVGSNLTIDFFEDKGIASATRYYYGVFTERGGVYSQVAVCQTPVQMFGDVMNIRQEMVEDKISVKWDAPDNVKEIQVWKKKGTVPPQRTGDGERVKTASMEGFTDSASGENSYYIACRYEINGQTYWSRGVARMFKNYEILKPIEGVNVTQLSLTEFLFEGTVHTGKIRLIFIDKKLTCRTNVLLQNSGYGEAVSGGRELALSYDADGKITFTLPLNSVGYVYPVIYNDQLFMVAPPLEVNSVSGIRNLNYVDNGSNGLISGVLNPKVLNVIAKISEKGYVNSFSDPADTIKVTASDFNATGGIKLSLKRNVDYYVTIFCEVDLAGRTALTKGERYEEVICQRDKIVVKFALEYVTNPVKPFKVTVKFAADSAAEIPECIIKCGMPKPLDKSKGDLIEKIAKTPLKKGLFGKEYTYKITLTVPPMARNTQLALFPAGDSTGYIQLKEQRSL